MRIIKYLPQVFNELFLVITILVYILKDLYSLETKLNT